MNIAQEVSKIQKVLESGRFVYNGQIYTLNAEFTKQHPDNRELDGRPLRRFVGVDGKGNTAIVWSHDCTECTTVIETVEQPEYVQSVTENVEPVIEPAPHPSDAFVPRMAEETAPPKRKKKFSLK